MKGYKLIRPLKDTIPKGITFVAVWNTIIDDIEIGVVNKREGFDYEGNIVIDHFNIVNTSSIQDNFIELEKCMGCDLNNYEFAYGSNCSILCKSSNLLMLGSSIARSKNNNTTPLRD